MAASQLSPLELLPTEVLVLVLSAAARFPADLGSLIRTSSRVHTCFNTFKVSILTAPALLDLGPAIVEAIALSRLGPFIVRHPADTEGLHNTGVIQDYILQYYEIGESLQKSASIQWITRKITPRMAGSILRLNIAVQFFADLYLATRISYLQNQISLLTESIARLAASESAGTIATLGRDDSHSSTLISKRTTLQALHTALIASHCSEEKEENSSNSKNNGVYMNNHSKILSPLERKRLCQSFLRVQLLVIIAGRYFNSLQHNAFRDERPFNPPFEETEEIHNNGHPGGENEGHENGILTNSPSSAVPSLVSKIMDLYRPWEKEQISQAHYFGYVLASCVIGVDDWHKKAPKGYGNNAVMRRRLRREKHYEITAKCQFDLVGFRRRLMKGGAGACLGLEPTGPQRGQVHDGGCLSAWGFDSVRATTARGDGGSSTANLTTVASSEGRESHEYHYEPLPVPSRDKPMLFETQDLERKLMVLPVSNEHHGSRSRNGKAVEGVCHDDGHGEDEDSAMMTTFGPGPGAPQNVHPLECHIALRLLLLRGEGRPNGTCMVTERTNIQWLCASHRYERDNYGWPPPGKPTLRIHRPDDDGADKISDDPTASKKQQPSLLPEPYAWTDALDGLKWDRWGMDFVPLSPEDQATDADGLVATPPNPRKDDVDYRFARWRYLGLVFWDEERVRDVRRALGGDYETGWLGRVWD